MRYRLWTLGAIPLLGAMLTVALLPVGCGSSDKSKPTETGKKTQEDPWLKVASTLRQETDATACRRVLTELNQALASTPVDQQGKLGDAEAAFAQSSLNLDEAEMKEIRSSGYTSLDPNHLAETLYLRDVARSLDVAKLPVAERARVAFEWVCRQVVLNPWKTRIGRDAKANRDIFDYFPPLPPSYVLRRGSGSGLERMLVFVALCRQLEIEAYLIGPAEAVGQPLLHQPKGREGEFPRGPFWAMGVRDGTDILLYDPWKEQAYPGKNGRPATLADVRADPRGMAVWLDNKPFAWPVTVDDLKSGEIYLIASLSSVAPRHKILEEKIPEIGAKLFVNLAESKKLAEIAAKGAPVRYYSPAKETYSPTRALNNFLRVSDGGTAAENPNALGLYDRSVIDQLPTKGQLLAIPAGFAYDEPKERLLQRAAGTFAAEFLTPPTPREKIQRGQFVEVTQTLVRLREAFAAVEARLRSSDAAANAAATREWVALLNSLYDKFNNAGPGDQATLRAQIEELWQPSSKVLHAILSAAIAKPGLSEATYLIALAKHEQAERAWTKFRRLADTAETDPNKKVAAEKARQTAKNASADAWAEAREWWSRYQPYVAFQSPNYPGRAELVKRLTDRAEELGAAK